MIAGNVQMAIRPDLDVFVLGDIAANVPIDLFN